MNAFRRRTWRPAGGSGPRAWSSAGMLWVLGSLAAVVVRADDTTLAEERAFRAAVARVAGAVVRLEPGASVAALATAAEGVTVAGPGTGLVVDDDAAAGMSWIVTTSLTVPDDVDKVVVVRPDGARGVGRVTGRDRTRSLVLLETARLAAGPRLEPVPRSELEPGQWAIAVGRGWNQAAPGVSVGIVSATDRCWGRAVQTDAAVSPANYGGPLVDIRGRVIGLLAPLPADTAGMNQGTELYDAGIGFAVPLQDILRVLPRLKRGAPLQPGILGITWHGADPINGPPLVGSCRSGSPAERAGLRGGDRIVEIAGREVRRVADARHQLMPRYAGDEVDVVIERGGDADRTRIAVRVVLTDRLPAWKRATIGLLPREAGQARRPATEDDSAARGVVVERVLAGGAADKGGIRAGDRITSIHAADADTMPVATLADLVGALAGIEPAASVQVGYVRQGKAASVDVVTTEPPVDPAAVLWSAADDAPAAAGPRPDGATDAATVMTLEVPDERQRPIAVVPAARGAAPLPLVVYCGPPRGPLDEAAAAVWKAAVARHGVAVLLPGSLDPQRWGPADIAAIGRGIVALDARRPIDRSRIAIAGSKAGGTFAWLVAERFGPQARGVAVIDAPLPRQASIEPVDPARWKWVLFGAAAGAERSPRVDADRRRLTEAGYPVGELPGGAVGPPADPLCRFAALLGLL